MVLDDVRVLYSGSGEVSHTQGQVISYIEVFEQINFELKDPSLLASALETGNRAVAIP